MSIARVYADSVAAEKAKVATAESACPAPCALKGMIASVTQDGGAYLNKEATLSADEALALGQWLVATFG